MIIGFICAPSEGNYIIKVFAILLTGYYGISRLRFESAKRANQSALEYLQSRLFTHKSTALTDSDYLQANFQNHHSLIYKA